MIPQVFLSLSGVDDDFVGEVEENVIEGVCFYYRRSFQNGDSLIEEMEKHVNQSSIFVLFASKSSVESVWVKFEIDHARIKKIKNSNFRILVFPADKTVDFSDLPVWMRDYWFDKKGRSPRDVARYINSEILLKLMRPQIFGRGGQLDDATNQLQDVVAERQIFPNVFLFNGIEQIGRRTFAREFLARAFPHHETLQIGPYITLSDPADITDFYRRLRRVVVTDTHKGSVKDDILVFQDLGLDAQLGEIINLLKYFGNLEEAVFIHSTRGLFDDFGSLQVWIKSLIKKLATFPRIRLVLISNRRVKEGENFNLPNLYQYHIEPLKNGDIKGFISNMARRAGSEPPALNDNIYTAIGGHPVFARAYFRLVQQRGQSLANHNINEIYDVQEHILSANLNYDQLTEIQQNILCVLSWVPRLDSEVLRKVSAPEVGDEYYMSSLDDLVLCSLIEINANYFAISNPVRSIYRRKHGYGDKALIERLASEIKKKIELQESRGHLDFDNLDALLFIYSLEGKSLPAELSNLMVPSTMLSIAREVYAKAKHESDENLYELGANFAASAENLRMDEQAKESILAVAVRCNIKLGRDDEVKELLERFEKRGYPSYHSLMGTWLRQRQDYENAIPAFRKAIKLNIHNEALLHELCICLFASGKFEEIDDLLKNAGDKVRKNSYLIDLRIQLLTAQQQFDPAEKLITVLRNREDDDDRSYKREAILILRRGDDPRKALKILDNVIERRSGASIDFRTVRFIALTEAGEIGRAREDLRIIRSKSSQGEKFVLRLEAIIDLAQGNWQSAIDKYNTIDKKNAADRLLEARILEKKCEDMQVPLKDRRDAQEKALLLRKKYKLSSEYEF